MKRKKKKKHRKTNGIIKIINKIIFALNFCFWKVMKFLFFAFLKKNFSKQNKKTNERTKNKHRSLSLCLCVCVSSAYLHTNKTKNVRTGNASEKKVNIRNDRYGVFVEKNESFFLKFFFWKKIHLKLVPRLIIIMLTMLTTTVFFWFIQNHHFFVNPWPSSSPSHHPVLIIIRFFFWKFWCLARLTMFEARN